MIATMLTALLMVSGVALAKGWIGTPKNERHTGNERGDVFSARGGNDEIYGQPGGNSISGSDVADNLYGGDELSGGNNNDTINALGGGRDLINCGLGNDDQVIADEVDGVQGDREKITER
jgi:Ca2+-binding RTX toxin-like protein